MDSIDLSHLGQGPIVYFTPEEWERINNPPIPHLSESGRRLFWTLQGPLSTSITVLNEDRNPDGPREPYLPAGAEVHHPIGNDPISTLPVVTLTVSEENIDGWRDGWDDLNYEAFDEDIQPSPADLPPTFEPVVVTASNGEFVSIHDYVTVVHPWLMARREEILRARHVADDHYEPGAAGEERLLVVPQNTELVVAEDEEEWVELMREAFVENQRRRQEDEARQAAQAGQAASG